MTVLEFKPRQQAQASAPAQPVPIPAMPIMPVPKAPAPVVREPEAFAALPASVLDEMCDALVFYSRAGFDHGVMAQHALRHFVQPTPGNAA
jgi:hypothetical protein